VQICLILTFCGPPKKNQTAASRKTTCVTSSQYLKCHRNVTEQTNPLQVKNLITNKTVAIL